MTKLAEADIGPNGDHAVMLLDRILCRAYNIALAACHMVKLCADAGQYSFAACNLVKISLLF